jgi:Carboxypeptidase regulatory-like domain
MEALTKNQKVTIWAAVIVAVGSVVGATIPGVVPPLYNWAHDDRSKEHINGTVSDAVTKAPIPGIVVQLETNEGRLLTQDTTDRDGKFNLVIPKGVDEVRVVAAIDGYVPYDEKLPAREARNDIALVRQLLGQGIPDGTRLDDALRIVAGKLNITAVFSKGCSKKATAAAINGGHIEGDARLPGDMLKGLLTRVKDNTQRYDIITIEEGKRYEVRCF